MKGLNLCGFMVDYDEFSAAIKAASFIKVPSFDIPVIAVRWTNENPGFVINPQDILEGFHFWIEEKHGEYDTEDFAMDCYVEGHPYNEEKMKEAIDSVLGDLTMGYQMAIRKWLGIN